VAAASSSPNRSPDQGFGLATRMKIAEGESLPIYQPTHPTPLSP